MATKLNNNKAFVAGGGAAGTAGLMPVFFWIYTTFAGMPVEAAIGAAAASAGAIGALATAIFTWFTRSEKK